MGGWMCDGCVHWVDEPKVAWVGGLRAYWPCVDGGVDYNALYIYALL